MGDQLLQLHKIRVAGVLMFADETNVQKRQLSIDTRKKQLIIGSFFIPGFTGSFQQSTYYLMALQKAKTKSGAECRQRHVAFESIESYAAKSPSHTCPEFGAWQSQSSVGEPPLKSRWNLAHHYSCRRLSLVMFCLSLIQPSVIQAAKELM